MRCRREAMHGLQRARAVDRTALPNTLEAAAKMWLLGLGGGTKPGLSGRRRRQCTCKSSD